MGGAPKEQGQALHCLPACLQRPGPSTVALLSVGSVSWAGGQGQEAAEGAPLLHLRPPGRRSASKCAFNTRGMDLGLTVSPSGGSLSQSCSGPLTPRSQGRREKQVAAFSMNHVTREANLCLLSSLAQHPVRQRC